MGERKWVGVFRRGCGGEWQAASEGSEESSPPWSAEPGSQHKALPLLGKDVISGSWN